MEALRAVALTRDPVTPVADGGGGLPPGSPLTAVVAVLGVVYGDIGTSPLYALRECFSGGHGLPATPADILGVLSLVTWSLILVVSVKYLLILRADNDGEGAILAVPGQRGPLGPRVAGGLANRALRQHDVGLGVQPVPEAGQHGRTGTASAIRRARRVWASAPLMSRSTA